MAEQSALAAVATTLRALATDSSNPQPIRLKLPVADSPEAQAVEFELASLVLRIQHLEAKAGAANGTVFPDTPNETSDNIFADDTASSPSNSTKAHKSKHPVPPIAQNGFIDKALEGLREHVDDQSKLLDSQRQELAGVNAQLMEQKQLQERALAMLEQERVATLERELWKHQKANEAFQKALREIGEIVTAVARGDLSKKVRMNSVEMDPEITTFKRTINTMMDQLQVFSSEVSRVAREVGTEGILGGQAQIEGVDGTWKELTDNGTSYLSIPKIIRLRQTPYTDHIQ